MRPIYEEVPVLYIEDCEKVTGEPCISTDEKECEACNEICYNCGDEAIDVMAQRGYDVYDLLGPYMSDEIHKNVMWVKSFKMNN